MAEFPFQLRIKRTFPGGGQESLLCTDLLREVPGRRTVYDAIWNETDVVAKVFSHKIHARRHLRKEWRGLKRLQERGLACPEPLFYGSSKSGGWIIVIQKIADSSTILEILNRPTNKQIEVDLLIRVCRELAKQHSKGILQKDLHLGNFLLACDKIYALDPNKMQFFRNPISRNKSIFQVALLLCCLPTCHITTSRIICNEYFECRGWHFKKSDEALLQKQMAVYRRKGFRHLLKKSLRTSGNYLKIANRQYTAVFNRDFCNEAEPPGLIGRLDALMDGGQILKDGNTCYVSRLSVNGKDVVVKRYNNKGFVHALRHTIKRSRARWAWLHGHRLRMLNIATPRPLAYIERYKGLLIEKSYLITEYVEGQRLYEFLQDDNIANERRSQIIQTIKAILEKLAKHRITHGDLKHTNILITETGPVLTDLDGMMVHRSRLLYRKKRRKDIERFIRGTEISVE